MLCLVPQFSACLVVKRFWWATTWSTQWESHTYLQQKAMSFTCHNQFGKCCHVIIAWLLCHSFKKSLFISLNYYQQECQNWPHHYQWTIELKKVMFLRQQLDKTFATTMLLWPSCCCFYCRVLIKATWCDLVKTLIIYRKILDLNFTFVT